MLDAAGVRYYKYNRTDREITIKSVKENKNKRKTAAWLLIHHIIRASAAVFYEWLRMCFGMRIFRCG